VFLVFGATGNVGSALVDELVARGQAVRAVSRSGRAIESPLVEAVTGDLNEPGTLGPALEHVHGAFLLSGYRDSPRLLELMRSAGVRKVVLLSTGAVENGDIRNVVVRFNLVTEAAVLDSGIDWAILRPSGFHSNALRWLPQLRVGDVVAEPFADVPVASIDPADIAAVAADGLLDAAHDGRIHRLTGPEALLPEQRLEILGDRLGRRLTLRKLSSAESREWLRASMPTTYVDAFFDFFEQGAYDDSRCLPTTEALLRRPPKTFEQWARDHATAFTQ
jgi:uncharacterized protein YbjT (DUF2867 family)